MVSGPLRPLSSRQFAQELGVDVRTVHRWAKAGLITPTVQGPGPRGPLYFTRQELALTKRRRGRSG